MEDEGPSGREVLEKGEGSSRREALEKGEGSFRREALEKGEGPFRREALEKGEGPSRREALEKGGDSEGQEATNERKASVEREAVKEKEASAEQEEGAKEEEGTKEAGAREDEGRANDASSGYRRKFMVIEEFLVSLAQSDDKVQVVIAGEEDRLILAVVKKITKRLKDSDYLSGGKIARIHAEKLNKVDLKAKANELVGGCMLIEEAAKLEAGTIKTLKWFMEEHAGKCIVILTDRPEKMRGMLQQDEELDDMITHFLEI